MHYRRHYHPRPSLHSSLADSQNSTGLNDQALLFHCSAKNFLIIRLLFSITAFCIRIYRAGRGLSSLELSCNLHRIKPLVDCKLRLKCDGTRADIRFRPPAKHRVHLNRQGRQFSLLLVAEVCASAVVMLDTPCSEEAWLPTPFASFPLTSPHVLHRLP